MANAMIITSTANSNLEITALPGHFVTSHSHVNYYIDISKMKHHHMMAREAAIMLAAQYAYEKVVDTIVCLEGSGVIATFLAQQLSKNDMLSMNRHKNIYVVTPEYNVNGQMIFRDNLQQMIRDQHVLLLIASVTTGKTIKRALECINYYGGAVQGISALFSVKDEAEGIPIHRLFSSDDIPNYETHSYRDCPQCKAGIKIDGLANSFGFSKM